MIAWKKTFLIIPKDLNDMTNLEGMELYAKDKVFTSKKNGWKQGFQIYDFTGKKLTKSDFDSKSVIYTIVKVPEGGAYDNLLNMELKDPTQEVPAGCTIQIKAVMKAGGNYRGEITGTYRILEKGYDISKAVIQLMPQSYTGSTIEIGDDGDIKKATIRQNGKGVDLKLEGTGAKEADLRVVEGSYVKNIEKGTARVTLEGVGPYGGRKTVTFKITARSINAENIWDGFFRLSGL